MGAHSRAVVVVDPAVARAHTTRRQHREPLAGAVQARRDDGRQAVTWHKIAAQMIAGVFPALLSWRLLRWGCARAIASLIDLIDRA